MHVFNRRRLSFALIVLAAVATPSSVPSEESRIRWVTVEYGNLIDRRKLTHSGESVGGVLGRLAGRSMPDPRERPGDALAYRLLDPVLEPYAFVLPDALDTLAPPPETPMVEVGGLWEPGAAQPAWVELARARRLLVESDGEGQLRVCLPGASDNGTTPEDPVAAARAAWRDAWPILRHAMAGERRRLAHRRGGEPPALEVQVHAYRHDLARSRFELGVMPWRTTIGDTGPTAGARPLDLAALSSILDRGLQIEGARLEPSGRLRWLLGDSDVKPSILGRAPTIADLAVAYRAIARGGYGEPYMSLDRASAPQLADVNYGGRLRDTALGMVSLLSDVRFKTFSVGVDLLGAGDIRDAIRRSVPGFRTHLERFAADPSAGAVLNQQTRFWFYPDGVDLTLSAEGDVLAFRKVRMSAASERVQDAGQAAADPPWTRETIAFVNAHYDGLAVMFPEMSDLDESVRWLSVFTWLEAARARGLPVPDLDVLLALELPSVPTPRRFPQLLSYDVLAPPGGSGVVDVLNRTVVGTALERLEPAAGKALPAVTRLRRALAMLNRQIPDQGALARELEAQSVNADAATLDLLSFRAERLLMHARVLATLTAAERSVADARRAAQPATRVFSIGIGGVDLGTGAILARAQGRASKLGLSSAPGRTTDVASGREAAEPNASAAAAPAADPPGLPATEWPDHGLGPKADRVTSSVSEGRGTIVGRRLQGANVRKGTWKVADGRTVAWEEFVLGIEGPETRSRRRIPDPEGGPASFERFEDGRFLAYRFERDGATLSAAVAVGRLPDSAFGVSPEEPERAVTIPTGLAVMNLVPTAGPGLTVEREEPAIVTVRVRDADGRDRSAAIPRSLLQRLVLGREVDMTPGRPLAAFTPAPQILGASRVLMVMQPKDGTRAPWTGPIAPVPGEEDPRRLADALTRWWVAESDSAFARAVVGVDPVASPARWSRAPTLDGSVTIVASADAFPGTASGLRAPLAGLTRTAAPSRLVIVASAEPPGLLGRRLRALATDPSSAGTIVAVAALGGPLRPDLPASLLAEGRLGAVGVLEAGPVGGKAAIDEVVRWVSAVSAESAKGRRAEDIAGPFTWYY